MHFLLPLRRFQFCRGYNRIHRQWMTPLLPMSALHTSAQELEIQSEKPCNSEFDKFERLLNRGWSVPALKVFMDLLSTQDKSKINYQHIHRLLSNFNRKSVVSMKDLLYIVSCMEELGIPPDTRIYNALIHGYVKCNDLSSAQSILDQMKSRDLEPDAESYYFFLKYFEQSKDWKGAQVFVSLMKQEGKPLTIDLYNLYLKILIEENQGQVVEETLKEIKNTNVEWDESTLIYCIDFYFQNDQWEKALSVFDSHFAMVSNDPGNGLIGRKSFTCLISHLLNMEKYEEADAYIQKMLDSGIKLDAYAWNTKFKSLVLQDKVSEAVALFQTLSHEHAFHANSDTFSILCQGLCDHDRAEDAIKLLETMNSKELKSSAIEPIFKYFCENRMQNQAMALFESLKLDQLKMTPAMFHSFLAIVCQSMSLDLLDKLWLYAKQEATKMTIKSKKTRSSVLNRETYQMVFETYIKCQKLDEANSIFTDMLVLDMKPDPKLVLELIYANVLGRRMLKASELISWLKSSHKNLQNSKDVQVFIQENKKDFENAIRKIHVHGVDSEEDERYSFHDKTEKELYNRKMPSKEDIIIRIYKEFVNAQVSPDPDIYTIVMEAHKDKNNMIGVIQVWSSLQKSGHCLSKSALSCLITSALKLGKQKTAAAVLNLCMSEAKLQSLLDSECLLGLAELSARHGFVSELERICVDLSDSGYEIHPELISEFSTYLATKSKSKSHAFQKFIKEYFPQPLEPGLDTFSNDDKTPF